MSSIFMVTTFDDKSIKSAKFIHCNRSPEIQENLNQKCLNIENGHVDSGINKQEIALKWTKEKVPTNGNDKAAECVVLSFELLEKGILKSLKIGKKATQKYVLICMDRQNRVVLGKKMSAQDTGKLFPVVY